MPSRLFCFNRHLSRALCTVGIVVVIAFLSVLCSAAFGANPAEEMAKMGAANSGIDPKGNSWLSIQHSVEQFGHPEFILRLFLSLSLAVGCAYAIAWHPRRASLVDPLADLEERKALILLGVVGAVVAELSGSNQTLAFVIFGIGALLRFRTVLDNPKLTGKAIMVVVVGLACGMGSWAMAVFVTAFVGYSFTGLIRTRAAGSESGSTTPRTQSRSLAWCNRCSSPTSVGFRVPRSTKTRDRWCSSCISRVESTQGTRGRGARKAEKESRVEDQY